MSRKFGTVAVLGGFLLVAGCGGGTDSSLVPGGGGGGGSLTVLLGSGSGDSFQQGALGIINPDLPAGGSTTVLAALQYSDGTSYTNSATLTFTSPCYQNGLAVFTVNGEATNTVIATGGQASITYSATGCSGSDAITATAVINSNVLHATGTVTVAPATVLLGSGSGASFQAGVLDVAVPQLSAGGSTTVSATLQYSDGTPYTTSATLTFTSPCYQSGLAAFTVNGETTNTFTTATGQANITYSATGCSGSDTITATTTVDGDVLTAVGTVTVASAAVGSILFVSATPLIISLKGTGGPQTSIVVFKVTDSTGGPVPGAKVNFSVDTTVGGITFAPAGATTGNDDQAQTVVQAGTQHTTVRVTAAVTAADGEIIATQSPGIVISTGIPTEQYFSLSLTAHNVEGFDVDGVGDTVKVILSDRFGNPVPEGTPIAFTTNGGQIQPSCTTDTMEGETTSSCTVTWTSANPRPPNGPLSVIGHADILAYTTGEESFTDVNGDGIFDQGDQFSLYPQLPNSKDQFFGAPLQDDIGEIYLDQDQSGSYLPGDFFFDFNHDGVRNPPDGKYHGNGCVGTDTVPCGQPDTFGVGLQDCIVMATSQVNITGPATLIPGQSATYYISDLNQNVPPAGMKFLISADGPKVSILQTTVPDIGGCPLPPAAFAITVKVAATSKSGTFVIQATSPVTGTLSFSDTINVQEAGG